MGYFDSFNDVRTTLSNYGGAVNGLNVLYRPWGPNSNSFAFGAVEKLVGFRPESSVLAIGSDVNVKLWARSK